MNVEQEEVMNKILSDFGAYVERNPLPPIFDSALLPYPKDVIYSALEWKERLLCDTANSFANSGSDVPQNIDKILEAVQSLKVILSPYATIDDGDLEKVKHFNSFGQLTDVPKDLFGELFPLRIKYSKRGSADLQRER